MPKVITPGDFVTQGRGESVIYELPWETWDDDLKGSRTSKPTVQILKGPPLGMTPMTDLPGTRRSRLLIKAGTVSGHYQVTRTVSTVSDPPERRVKTFTVLVE